MRGQIRYALSDATAADALLEDLVVEVRRLGATDAGDIDTTLLIHPHVLGDFLDYNDFLDVVDAVIEDLGMAGVIQVASFHPDYQFAGTAPDDIENFTNRSPYPTLHLLREASVARAVAAHPDTEKIYEDNIAALRRLGRQGWDELGLTPDAVQGGRPPAIEGTLRGSE